MPLDRFPYRGKRLPEGVSLSERPAVISINERKISDLVKAFRTSRSKKAISGLELKGSAKLTSTAAIIDNQISELGLDTLKSNLETQITIELLPPFSKGKLTINPLDSIQIDHKQTQYEAVIRFDDNILPSLRYKTNPLRGENINSITSRSAVLASLDRTTIKQVMKKGSLLVITTNSHFKDKDSRPLESGNFIQLTWNEEERTIEAVEVYPTAFDLKRARTRASQQSEGNLNTNEIEKEILKSREQSIQNNERIFFFINKVKAKRD